MGGSDLRNFLEHHAMNTPSMFIVISYKRLKSALKKLHAPFTNGRLIKAREVNGKREAGA